MHTIKHTHPELPCIFMPSRWAFIIRPARIYCMYLCTGYVHANLYLYVEALCVFVCAQYK